MQLYVTPTSPYARLAMIARLEKGLDGIELVWTRTRVPDDPMLAFNPSGRIPFLRLDDGTGFEDTDVIVDFIDTLAPPCRFAPPWGEAYWPYRRRRAAARSMLDGVAVWARETLRPEGERSPAIIDHERRRAMRLADAFEAEIATPAWAAPLDMPQLLLFCTLDVERRLPEFDWRTGRPGLVAWHARIAALPSVEGSLPPAGV
ncbi:MAG: glutathione S-transferase [Defluviicoccus sp.]|nr:glutathione S-transferase [Defluviicoccus sp.]MDE0277629.1 glutathione S-transferase [Defluviicoccus sp.]